MNLDWRRLKAVVLESDDWGLCAWVPDDQAHRVLAGQPAFRSDAGRRYGRSTLESAADVRALADVLLAVRGGDGLPPVWQANTIVAAPDFSRLLSPQQESVRLPLMPAGTLPGRWRRPGMDDAVRRAEAEGVWWAELHGLHHLPAAAWLRALERGEHDARRALEQESPICAAVEAGGEYDPAEPRDVRAADLREALARFRARFGRSPTSFCPPDYRFDAWLEAELESLGITALQGKAEQPAGWRAALRRRWFGRPFPELEAGRFHLPPRIAFEPRGEAQAGARLGADAALAAARRAWAHARPAIVSTHRLNYAHLDAAWSQAGRSALGDFLGRLAADGAMFLTDMEVHQLVTRDWSVRARGTSGALLRYYGAPGEPVQWPAPAGARDARLMAREGSADGPEGSVKLEGGTAEARVGRGEHRIEWVTA